MKNYKKIAIDSSTVGLQCVKTSAVLRDNWKVLIETRFDENDKDLKKLFNFESQQQLDFSSRFKFFIKIR